MRLIDGDALKEEVDMAWCPDMAVSEIWNVIDDAPTVSGWVSVKDRLPEHGKRYLIYATSGDNKIGYITTTAFGGHFVLSGRRAYWKVTHWMPLPEPPEVKNE